MPDPPTRERATKFIPAAIWLAFAALAARMFHLIATHAVNLLWWDEWDLYSAFMRHASLWQLFRWEHTGVRQGISFMLLSAVAQATAWNSKDAAYLVAAFVLASAVLALMLKLRLFGPLAWSDLIIPLIFFTPMQYESFLGTAVPAFSSFPIFLILLLCLAWLIARPFVRYTCVLFLNFLVLYSGYGFFAALLTPALLALDAFRFARLKQAHEALAAASALLIALASLVTFFVGYAFIPAAACYRFPLHPLYAYPWFAALLLANPFRLKGHGPLATTIGGLLLLVLICIAVRRFAELLRNKEGSPLARVIALLSGYTLLYIAAAAVGRLCFGLDYAQQSRYVVFMNLALFAFYLAALGLRNARTQRWAIALLFLGLLAGNFYPAHRDTAERDYFFETKTRWKQCYLRYEDITRCDREAGGVAHPNPAATHMKEKLDYLKAIA